MPYNQNIPQAAHMVSVSQNDLLINFQGIAAAFGNAFDNADLNGADVGKHNKIRFVRQAAAPAVAGNDLIMYNLVHGAISQLWFNRPGGTAVPFTEYGFTVDAQGYTYLPSGLLLKFGRALTAGAGATYTVNLNSALLGANYTQKPFVLVIPEQAAGNLYRWAQLRPGWTAANFTVDTGNFAGAATVAYFQWFTIGTF